MKLYIQKVVANIWTVESRMTWSAAIIFCTFSSMEKVGSGGGGGGGGGAAVGVVSSCIARRDRLELTLLLSSCIARQHRSVMSLLETVFSLCSASRLDRLVSKGKKTVVALLAVTINRSVLLVTY